MFLFSGVWSIELFQVTEVTFKIMVMSLIDGTQMIYCKGPFIRSAERSGVDAHSVNVVIVFIEFDYNGHARIPADAPVFAQICTYPRVV